MSELNLEPRLIEYLKRRKYYEENNIDSTVSLEKQYMITKHDMNIIKKYLNNEPQSESDEETENNGYRKVKNYDHMIEVSQCKFPSSQIHDPRLDRINKKMQKEKEANLYRGNTVNLRENYDMYDRNFSSTTSKDFSQEFSLDNIINEMNDVKLTNYNAYDKNKPEYFKSSYQVNNNHNQQNQNKLYHNQPKIDYNQRLYYEQQREVRNNNFNSIKDLTNVLNLNQKSYRQPQLPKYAYESKLDVDNKVVLPSNNCRKANVENLYKNVESMTGGKLRDVDIENYIKYGGYGNTSSKARSMGWDNPVEHYFQYIDDDIQAPEHVVNDRPYPSRLENREHIKQKTRDIY